MPVSSFSSATTGANIDQNDAPSYCAKVPFKHIEAFLNRKVSICTRNTGQLANFSLFNLLRHLNIRQGCLKGSAVGAVLPANNRAENTNSNPHDIDFQLPYDDTISVETILDKLKSFMETHQQTSSRNVSGAAEAKWFNRVSDQMKGAWNRLIISVGTPGINQSTLDLNFDTSSPSYDTINASRSIQFNLDKRVASLTGYWEPKLVKLLQNKKWLWFKPDIEDGLARLSYRLSKTPEARLLQPEIVEHFLQTADATVINNIYLRVLCNEYQGCTLNTAEKLALWKPLIDEAFKEESKNQNQCLRTQLLNWSKCNNPEQLHDAIENTGMSTIVLRNLTTGCTVVADFKRALGELLKNHIEIQDTLKPLMSKALGATPLNGEALFDNLDEWVHIQEIPEQELQAVFGGCLKLLKNSDNAAIAQRVKHMQGWLNGDKLASLQFWLDRTESIAPEKAKTNRNQALLDALLNVLKSQSSADLLPETKRLNDIQLSKDEWHQIVAVIHDHELPDRKDTNPQPLPPLLEFISVLNEHKEIIGALMPKNSGLYRDNLDKIHSTLFHKDMIALSHTLQTNGVPAVLRTIMKLKGEELGIDLPEMSVAVSTRKNMINLEVEKSRHWITENAFASVLPNETGGENISILWRDSAFFRGKRSRFAGQTILKGQMESLRQEVSNYALKGLLDAGRSVCQSMFSNTPIEYGAASAQGVFNDKKLQQAHNLETALLSLKEGVIIDCTVNNGLTIQHEINNYTPTNCNVQLVNKRYNGFVNFEYAAPDEPTSSRATGFENIWGVIPKSGNVTVHHLLQAAPLGIQKMISQLPWQRPGGSALNIGTLESKGPVPFSWRGVIEDNVLLPMGSLFLANETTPAITFDHQRLSDIMPKRMLPLMAELLGKRLNGSYSFVPRMWNNPIGWPPNAYEGFVFELPCGKEHQFSGYLTSTGRAIGILENQSQQDQPTSRAWAGSFQLLHDHEAPSLRFPVDEAAQAAIRVPAAREKQLAAHGFVHQYHVNNATQIPETRLDLICFCGESLPLSKATQAATLLYDSPGNLHYYSGLGYTHTFKGTHNEVQIDLMFNPGDGGSDFAMIRKLNYKQNPTRNDIYWNSQGMQAKWLVMNGNPVMGSIRFPSGLTYEGKVSTEDGFIVPTSTGKLELNQFAFSVEFGDELKLTSIKGLNQESRQWVNSYTMEGSAPTFDTKVMLALISGDKLSWENDVHAHLQIRDVKKAKDQVTVFQAPETQRQTRTSRAASRQQPRTSS